MKKNIPFIFALIVKIMHDINLLVVILMAPVFSMGQTSYFDYTVKPPDVASLFEVKSPTINESVGKPDISIPLFSIEIGDLQIPITLNYGLGGNRVEYESSWVGNSWTLTSNGVISRKLVDKVDEFEDFAREGLPGYNVSTGEILYPPCTVLNIVEDVGWLNNADDILGFSNYFKQNNGSTVNYSGPPVKTGSDKSPDIFYYTLPNGISGSFIFKNANTIINTGNEKIIYELNNDGIISEFEIIDTHGNRYLFEEVSMTGRNFYENAESYPALLSKPDFSLLFDGFPVYPCLEGNTYPYSSSTNGSTALYEREYADNWYLTKIISAKTKDEINYTYLESRHVSLLNTRSIQPASGPGYSYNSYNSTNTKIISSIQWKNGKIDFIKKPNKREDVIPNSIYGQTSALKALNNINIYDKSNLLIKKITFLTYYNEAKNIANETNINYKYIFKRLWLDGIIINDFSTNPLNYSFNYNQTKLPPRLSFEQDYWGYYNGNGSDTDSKYFIPHLWYYPGDVRSYSRPSHYSIFQRTNFQGQELTNNANFYSDRSSNLTYAKAGVLEEIIYPTGGKVKYEYELNKFLVEDQVIDGAGLRVKKIISNPIEGEDIIENYVYTDEQGVTTGKVTDIPSYATLYSVINSNKEYDINSDPVDTDVYYSKVERFKTGMGKVVTTFLIPFDFETEQSLYSDIHQDYFYEKNYNISLFLVRTGALTADPNTYDYGHPPKSLNYESLFGKILTRKVFNENEILLEEDKYTYDFTEKSERVFIVSTPFQSGYSGRRLNTVFIGNLVPMTFEKSTYFNVNNEWKSVTENNSYSYNEEGLVSEQITESSKGELIKNIYKYPFDLVGIEQTLYMQELVDLNRIGEQVITESYIGAQKLFESHVKYGKSSNTGNLLLPIEIHESKGNPSININNADNRKFQYIKYVDGNLVEYKKENGISTCLIWGYQKQHPIAKIENATYSQVSGQVANLQSKSNLDDDRCADTDSGSCDEKSLRIALNALRPSFPLAMVTTYTYDPLIGVTSITDPKGYTIYYDYDEFNRLEKVRDAAGMLLSTNKYHYKDQ